MIAAPIELVVVFIHLRTNFRQLHARNAARQADKLFLGSRGQSAALRPDRTFQSMGIQHLLTRFRLSNMNCPVDGQIANHGKF